MDGEIAPLDKTICGMPEELRFEDGTPVYNEDGVDLSHIRSFLSLTPAERAESATNVAQIFFSRASAQGDHDL